MAQIFSPSIFSWSDYFLLVGMFDNAYDLRRESNVGFTVMMTSKSSESSDNDSHVEKEATDSDAVAASQQDSDAAAADVPVRSAPGRQCGDSHHRAQDVFDVLQIMVQVMWVGRGVAEGEGKCCGWLYILWLCRKVQRGGTSHWKIQVFTNEVEHILKSTKGYLSISGLWWDAVAQCHTTFHPDQERI
jgi:hypothetical protein